MRDRPTRGSPPSRQRERTDPPDEAQEEGGIAGGAARGDRGMAQSRTTRKGRQGREAGWRANRRTKAEEGEGRTVGTGNRCMATETGTDADADADADTEGKDRADAADFDRRMGSRPDAFVRWSM